MNRQQIEVPMLHDNSPASAPPPPRSSKGDPGALARERLHAHRRRLTRIRKRVIATALVTFAVLWAVVFVQLVSGNDPSLSQKRAVVASSTSNGSSSGSGVTTSTSGSGTTSSGAGSSVSGTASGSSVSGTGSGSSVSATGAGTGTTSAITTSQS